jgi:hypothetical protein
MLEVEGKKYGESGIKVRKRLSPKDEYYFVRL